MSHQANISRIKAVNNALGTLSEKVVFVGGATASLYADKQAGEVRPTEDVDVLIEIYTYKEIARVEEQLRKQGFQPDMESSFKYRYRVQGIIVDIMPMDEEALGFSNRWYQEGFQNAINYKIDDHYTVKIFSPPYFIATKLEAFKHRGDRDGRTSEDFEDIVYVLENRASVWEELDKTSGELRKYLSAEVKKLQQTLHFEEWIDAHTERGEPPATYMIIEELNNFTAN